MSSVPISVIICAAGKSVRLGCDKLLLRGDKGTVTEMSVEAFDSYEGTKRIILAVSPGREDEFAALLSNRSWRCVPEICQGGNSRQETVRNALELLRDENGLIAVHDAARPFVSTELIEKTALEANRWGGALPMLKVKDTVHLTEEGFVAGTLKRENLRGAQTPQIFKAELLFAAYDRVFAEGAEITDECGAVLAAGGKISVVDGEERNIKITTAADLHHIKRRPEMKIGHGYDVHRFAENRKLILGGEEIPYELGLLGHSDADVLLHAIADSILGALALGDIGKHFPDTDPAYKGISSLILLKHVADLAASKGYAVSNLDSTVCCQAPKLAPHIQAMRKNIARVLGVEEDAVSVKATTEEKLGFTGRKEGISATAVCLLTRI